MAKPDILNVGINGPFSIFTIGVALGNGDGTFATPVVSFPAPNENPGDFAVVGLGDFNGDGKTDFLLLRPSLLQGGRSALQVYVSDGTGKFQPGTPFSIGRGVTVIGDFNGDGSPDVAVVDFETFLSSGNSSHVSVLLGNGDGTFRLPITTAVSAGTQAYETGRLGVAVADLNHDGKLDILAGYSQGNYGIDFRTGTPIIISTYAIVPCWARAMGI